jgi:hypothetical protein
MANSQTTAEAAARSIANYIFLKGWSKSWQEMSDQERDELIGVAQTIEYETMMAEMEAVKMSDNNPQTTEISRQ